MKRLKTILAFTYFIFSMIWLFTIYMIARTLKTPFFNLTIDPFGSWKLFDEQVERDTAIVTISILTLTGFYFLSWWSFLIALGVGLMNLIVFLVWMFIRSRKNNTDTATEIELIKQRLKFWKKWHKQ